MQSGSIKKTIQNGGQNQGSMEVDRIKVVGRMGCPRFDGRRLWRIWPRIRVPSRSGKSKQELLAVIGNSINECVHTRMKSISNNSLGVDHIIGVVLRHGIWIVELIIV